MALEDVAVPRDLERLTPIRDEEARLEAAQVLVGAPSLRELDARPRELAGMLVELPLEALEEGEGVGGRAREADDGVVLPRLLLDGLRPVAPPPSPPASSSSLGDDLRLGFSPPDDLGTYPPYLLGVRLDDDRSHRHHAVPHHADAAVLAHAHDGRAVAVGGHEGGGAGCEGGHRALLPGPRRR